ncbi:MAG TPA: EscU/YscU/HrcU family type III secretion system export apparatus switch protein [Candidatus Eisenbacteria bacterium]|nr:EscU/YscU/HrcU family type III secretion system export apparatus switch protein [Candidatus Eisenbacteria bacterium]
MIAEFEEDRTEAPTPRRLREARKKGQVAVSRDLAAALALLAAAAGLYLFGPGFLSGLRSALTRSLSSLHEMESGGATAATVSAGSAMLGATAPLILLALAAGAAATLAQVGFLFTGDTIRIKPERLDPFEGLRRIFSMRTFVAVTGGLAKGGIIVGVLAASLWQERVALAGLSTKELPEALSILTGSAIALFWKTAIALLALGLVDWGYRRWQHLRDLRMSRREVEDELKEFEGDPATRDRRRAHHAQIAESRQLASVSRAEIVLTDSEDLAIALGFEADSPVLLARGRGPAGDRIREAALGAGVPILERSDLARSLDRDGVPGAAVPAALREGVAEAIAVGKDMKGLGRHDA